VGNRKLQKKEEPMGAIQPAHLLMSTQADQWCLNTIHTLSMDAAKNAKSGHPVTVTARLAIEQASTFGWKRYVGDAGRGISMKTFGASAHRRKLLRDLDSESGKVVAAAKELLGKW
jgi:transketolase